MSNSVILSLPPLTWRDIKTYCSKIETSFQHSQPERPYAYVDLPGHDWTGLAGMTVTATLHFLNTIEPGMYPERWLEFREAVLDGTSGDLLHPDIGGIKARPMDGSFSITAQSVSGITVQCSWALTRDDADEEINFGTAGGDAAEAAAAADEAMAALDLPYPDGVPETSITGAVESVQGQAFSFGQQIGGAANQVKGTADRIAGNMDRLGEAYRWADPALRNLVAGDPARWVLESSLVYLRDAMDEIVRQDEASIRPVLIHKAADATTLSALASQLNNKMDDLVTLNPSLTSSPTVSKGASVRYYGAA